jgi:tripartite-type tricarboxylate transporter receptor subunit TctC
MIKLKLFAALFATAVISLAPAKAQNYPNRVVKIIVPAGPAGPTDLLGRLVATSLSNTLGQPVIIENKGGAGGAIGARAAATAAPDGYTLFVGNTATLANIPAVMKNADYDPIKDFKAVAKIMDSYQILVVRPDLPAKTVAELLAYAKANPGKLNYAAVGVGNITHLSGELLKIKTGADFVIIQYKSGGEAMTAVMSGQADFAIDNVAVARPLIDAGKLRALAVTSARRQAALPDLPTMIEAGVSGYVVTSFFGIVAPAGTPAPIVAKLHAEISAVLMTPKIQTTLEQLGSVPSTDTAEQFQASIVDSLKLWKEIADKANIKIE